MTLPWNEVRARAKAFAADHVGDSDERRDTQTFYNDFFEKIFGMPRTRVATYEKLVDKLGGARGFIDLFWPGELIVEQKSLGRDLFGARIQALDYLHGIKDSEYPKRVLVSDFRSFELTNLKTGETHAFLLKDLHRHVELFDFILGREAVSYADQDPVNIKAAELVGHLHDKLEEAGYRGHDLEQFLVRIVFCLFADDTGIFDNKGMLQAYLEDRTASDGSDTGMILAKVFQTLNTPYERRQSNLDDALTKFPYVNGDLFAKPVTIPDFDVGMRTALLNACRFDWTPISPAIFGSLFQSVMGKAERRKSGAHYTTEKNILKVIGPLFMDDLRAEFAAIRARKSGRAQALARFHDKLASLTFFDPACGCGNFLIIAYRDLRRLETELLTEIHADFLARMKGGATQLPVQSLSKVDVDQFFGIEIGEFATRIAETAMWMMDHLMNRELSEAFGDYLPRIPLKKAPTIRHGDALEIEWADVLPPDRCSYVLGNPPFVGAKYQSVEQRGQVRRIANLGKSGGTLDFVCAWFLKAGAYAGRVPSPLVGEGQGGGVAPRIAFVATNSITQGEQVAQLWPLLFDRYGLEIAFAHRTFAWGSDARGKAHVHVVILGLDRSEAARNDRRLFTYPDTNGDPVESWHKVLSPYLFDASGLGNPHLVVKEVPRPLNGLGRMLSGSQPIDNGHYIFDPQQREAFLSVEPNAEALLHPFVGSEELINGRKRWILALQKVEPTLLSRLPKVRERLRLVREFRSISKRKSTVLISSSPAEYNVDVRPLSKFLIVPEVSSEKRAYAPIGWADAPTIPSNLVRVILDATLSDFAVLTSSMHMSWLRHIGGRLESRYRYSIGLVYNTFPLPPAAAGGVNPALRKLEPLAQGILDARAAHPGATLADLYDPDLMPPNLRAAHTALDRAVDRLYRPSGFTSDRERVEHLFGLYERMVAPLLAAPKRGRKAPKNLNISLKRP